MAFEVIDVEGLDIEELLTLAGDVQREVVKRREALQQQLAQLAALTNGAAPPSRRPDPPSPVDRTAAILAFAEEHGDSKAALQFGLANAWAVKRLRKERDAQ